MLTEHEARAAARGIAWPLEPGPLLDFARHGGFRVDDVLNALVEIEETLPDDPRRDSVAGAQIRADLDALLEYFAEHANESPCPSCDAMFIADPGERCPSCGEVVAEPEPYAVTYWQ